MNLTLKIPNEFVVLPCETVVRRDDVLAVERDRSTGMSMVRLRGDVIVQIDASNKEVLEALFFDPNVPTMRGFKLLQIMRELPPGFAIGVHRNRAVFRSERAGKPYELIVESAPDIHVLDCFMTQAALTTAVDKCHQFAQADL